jgi:cytochrome P450
MLSNNVAVRASGSSTAPDMIAAASNRLCCRWCCCCLQDYHMLSNNVAVRASGSSTARDAAAAQEQLTRYMDNLVSRKEQHPSSDLISEVVQGQLKSGKITREQLVAHAFLLLVAGTGRFN